MSNYDHGATLERSVKSCLQANGYFAVKSGGSKGPVDVVAIKRGEILLVQCKTDGYLSPLERVELRKLALDLGAVPLSAGWHKNGRAARVIRFTELTSMGPAGNREWTPDYGMNMQTHVQEGEQ